MTTRIFTALVLFNIAWVVFFSYTARQHAQKMLREKNYPCIKTYQEYAYDETAPTLFGSKLIAFYTVYTFFNVRGDIAGNTTRTQCHDELRFIGNAFLRILFMLVWILCFAHAHQASKTSHPAQWLILIPTFLSLLGVMWYYQILTQ